MPEPAEKLIKILREARTIAIVGLSTDKTKDSFRAAEYLKSKGYRVFGVSPNPKLRSVWPDSYASLRDIPEPVDIADLFLRPEAVESAVDDAIAKRAKIVWMQLGIRHDAAKAEKAGLIVVMDTCIMASHKFLMRESV
ncbi:MAG: CoA-binding protein [Nitrospirae bacterium]|nr:CoA-binding protein [Nitrospirota bacterium]